MCMFVYLARQQVSVSPGLDSGVAVMNKQMWAEHKAGEMIQRNKDSLDGASYFLGTE